MKTLRFLKNLIFIFLGVVLLNGCKGKLKVGILMPKSQQYKGFVQEFKNGWDLKSSFIQDYHKKVEIIWENYEESPAGVQKSFENLLKKKVKFIIGPLTSQHATYVIYSAENSEIPTVLPAVTSVYVVRNKRYIWRFCTNNKAFARAFRWLLAKKLKLSNVIMYYQMGDKYCEELLDFIDKYLKESNVNIIEIRPIFKDISTKEEIQTIKKNKPDGIIIIAFPTACKEFVKELRKNGYNGLIFSGDSWDNPSFIEFLKKSGGTYYIITHFSPLTKERNIRNFVERYFKKYNSIPTFMAVVGYDMAGYVYKIAKEAPSYSKKALIGAMRKVVYNGLLGEVNFGTGNESGTKRVAVLKIEKGEMKFVASIPVSPY